MTFITNLLAALIGWIKPRVLLSVRWQRGVNEVFVMTMMAQLMTFGSVILVDVFEYYVIGVQYVVLYLQGHRDFNLKWYKIRKIPNKNELFLNTITRGSQAITLFALMLFCQFLMDIRSRKQAHRQQASRFHQQLKALPPLTWSECQKCHPLHAKKN